LIHIVSPRWRRGRLADGLPSGPPPPEQARRAGGDIMRMQFEHVSIEKKAVLADADGVAYTLAFPGGCRKTIGVVLAPRARFAPDCAEFVEVVEGQCRVRLGHEARWAEFAAGQRFRVPRGTPFELETSDPLHYVLHGPL
jgi:uncharacterized protein YaiE (UPF0345 family)